jgi:hypothetical protein
MDDTSPKGRPVSPKTDPAAEPSEGELSRMAREAVRQPPDPRLDKQLARLGLVDAAEPAEPRAPQPVGRPAELEAQIERLHDQLRRAQLATWALAGVAVILAVIVVVLLAR